MSTLTLNYRPTTNVYEANHNGNAVCIAQDLTTNDPLTYAYHVTGEGNLTIHCGKLYLIQAIEDVADILNAEVIEIN